MDRARRAARRRGLSSRRRIEPAAVGGDQGIRFRWAPCSALVLVHRAAVAQDRIQDSPRLLAVVLTREADRIAPERVEQQLFVRAHLGWTGSLADHELDLLPVELS